MYIHLISIKLITLLYLTFGLAAFTTQIDEDIRTIEIVGTDNMRFDVTEFEAKPGEKIRIVLKVVSRIPAHAMAHNVAVVHPDIDMRTFVNESMRATDNEYISPNFEDQVIAATKMIGGGETTEVTFTVPEEPGEYPYVCTWPGHFAAGMVGKMIVTNE